MADTTFEHVGAVNETVRPQRACRSRWCAIRMSSASRWWSGGASFPRHPPANQRRSQTRSGGQVHPSPAAARDHQLHRDPRGGVISARQTKPWKLDRRLSRAGRTVWQWMPIFEETLPQVLRWHWDNAQPLHPVYVAYNEKWTEGGWLRRFSCRLCIFATR